MLNYQRVAEMVHWGPKGIDPLKKKQEIDH